MKSFPLFWIVWFFLVTYLMLVWEGVFYMPSNIYITVFSVFVFLFINYFFYLHDGLKIFGLTHVHFLYVTMGSLALGWVYFFIGKQVVSSFDNRTIRFMTSNSYGPAVVLSMLSYMFYPLGCALGTIYKRNKNKDVLNSLLNTDVIIGWMGISLLLISALFFLALLATGVLNLSMSYSAFRAFVAENEWYLLIILLYSIGICSVVSCGNNYQKKIGWALFIFSAFIFFVTGNKGEVLYALLAVIGILRYKGMKINFKLVLALFFISFILIPFVTSTRKTGVASGIDSMGVNFTHFFVEIGFQIRCTVLMLEDFILHKRDFIDGYSYYSPIINILDHIMPFSIRISPPSSFDFGERFHGMGFNPVAEGYANFGTIGPLIYFVITGFYLANHESRKLIPFSLGLVGCICSELINVSRNRFAFFFGHVLIIYILYYGCLFLFRSRKRKKLSYE